jgi:hypothetical protein
MEQIISEQDEIVLGLQWKKCEVCGNSYCFTILSECPICKIWILKLSKSGNSVPQKPYFGQKFLNTETNKIFIYNGCNWDEKA